MTKPKTERKGPQAGPQTALLASPADMVVFGGAAGGGKSWGLLLAAMAYVHVEGYEAIIFRRYARDLRGSGTIWSKASEIYPKIGGEPRLSSPRWWKFPSGATIEFDHLRQEEDAEKHHQGRDYAFVGFDEFTHFEESQFWYLYGRLRSTCGVVPYMRATCNPDPDSFVRKLVDWWIDDGKHPGGPGKGLPIPERAGVIRYLGRDKDALVWGDTPAEVKEKAPARIRLADEPMTGPDDPRMVPMSFTFIPSKLSDNPALTDHDPNYASRIAVQGDVKRQQLAEGNWDVKLTKGTMFRRSWFRVVDHPPPDVVQWCRGWDLAATEPSDANPDPDWTEGAKVGITEDGRFVIAHMEGVRETPGGVERTLKNIAAQDDASGHDLTQCFWQDPAQAGKTQVYSIETSLMGYALDFERAAKNKVAYAQVWSPFAEHGRVLVVRGAWNERFFKACEAFPSSAAADHDDAIDAVSRAVHFLTRGGWSGFEAHMRAVEEELDAEW